jgi:hypothetical protein
MMEKKTPIQLSINPKSETENDIDHREHTRQLFYNMLRERDIKFNSETGEKIDENSDLETLTSYTIGKREKEEAKGNILFK